MSHQTSAKTAALLALTGQEKPPISVHQVASDMNITVERVELPPTQPGFAARIRDRWFIFVNSAHSPRRRRFTIGHELGHIALEHQGIVFLFNGEPRHMRISANRFAAELLMPRNLVHQEHAIAAAIDMSIRDLADTFLVDRRAMEIRLKELSLEL